MTQPAFNPGGYVATPADSVPVYIPPDECFVRFEGGAWVCIRPDHDHEPKRDTEEPA